MAQEQGITLSKQDLQDIIAAAIAAAKAPTVLEQAQLDEAKRQAEIKQENRKKTSAQVIAEHQGKAWARQNCSHEGPDGHSHAVYIQDGNYFICQKLQCRIRPGVRPEKDHTGDVYDTNLFNRLMQKVARQGDIFG